MSQEKAQLIAPIGIMTVSGVTATGVITATSFSGNIVGSAKSLVNGSDVTTGVITATSFVGNLTGNILRLADSAPDINVGASTATSFVGNLTGSVTDLTSAPAITVGMVTATTLEGPVTGNVTGNVSGLAGGLGVNYNGGWTGAGTSQINAGVVTATSFYGDGQYLSGVSGGPASAQSIGITSAATSIDLSKGNLITVTQSANTTVSFANTSNGNVYFIREKDATTTARTISWPDRIKWDGATEPTLLNVNDTEEAQIFLLVTRDMGVTWYGKEVFKNKTGGTLWGWGYNGEGYLGQNDLTYHSSPIQIPGVGWGINSGIGASDNKNFSGYSSGVIKTDGSLWTWGDNQAGSLGLNQPGAPGNRISSPTQVGTDTTWKTLMIGGANLKTTSAIKTDGTLWTWGENQYGQLGQTNNTKYSSPVQVGTDTDWKACFTSGLSCGGTKTDGTLWSWGRNNNGQLGQNNLTDRIAPTQVGTDTGWDSISGGWDGNLAFLKDNGTLWVTGDNYYGQLGQNQAYAPSNKARSSPVQIPGTDWAKTNQAVGYQESFGLKTNGTLWAWQYNGEGALGQNGNVSSNSFYSSPVQIPGTNWSDISCRYKAPVASKTDGTFWVWGSNAEGQLGLNQPTSLKYSSPVQLPGVWSQIISGHAAMLGFKA